LDREQIVQEAMRRIPPREEVLLQLRECEISDNNLVHNFLEKTCLCRKWDGKACSQQFSEKYVTDIRLSCKGLTKPELDMFVMGQLVAFSHSGDETSTNKKTPHERKRWYCNFRHQGKSICQDMFRLVNGIGTKHLRNLSKWLADSGVGPRVHGNTKRLPEALEELVKVVGRQWGWSSGAWQYKAASQTRTQVEGRRVHREVLALLC
jgi:hypothetical protein